MRRGELQELLPGLRTFARHLCGCAHEGDLLLKHALADLAAGRRALDTALTLRRAMIETIHACSAARHVGPADAEGLVDPRLADLSPRDRAVFVLVRLEGLSLSCAARLIGETTGLASVRLRRADMKLATAARQRRVLIVEDLFTAMELESLVEELGYVAIGSAATCQEAVTTAIYEGPDLILSDICLDNGSSGVEAVSTIRREIDVPVIFVTAFGNYLESNSLARRTYLASKPLDRNLLKGVITGAMDSIAAPPG